MGLRVWFVALFLALPNFLSFQQSTSTNILLNLLYNTAQNIASKLNGLKQQIFVISVSVFQESRCDLAGYFWLKISHEAAAQLSSRTASSQEPTGTEGSAS